MRRSFALSGVLSIALLAGCFSGPPRRDRPLEAAPADGVEGVVLDRALVEDAWAETYLDGEAWRGIDEQAFAPETRVALEDNGLRVGVLSAGGSDRLREMLASERYCVDPKRLRSRVGVPQTFTLGDVRPKLALGVRVADGSTKKHEWSDAQPEFQVSAAPEGDGRVRVRLVPVMRHGEKPYWAAVDRGGTREWTLDTERPCERWEHLAVEAVLGPKDCLVIGTRRGREGTLGAALFLAPDARRPAQRVFVLRAAGPAKPATPAPATPGAGPPPLAAQAFRPPAP